MKNDYFSELFGRVAVIDFECTSEEPKTADVIEYGILTSDGGELFGQQSLCSPVNEEITPENSAITNITPKMVENEMPFTDPSHLNIFESIIDGKDTFIAHNSFYDCMVLSRYIKNDIPWICTMRMAKKLYAEDHTVTQFNLPYLRYRFEILIDDDSLEIDPHRALSDAYVTMHLFKFFVKEMESRNIIDTSKSYLEQILEWLKEPIIYEIMPFGKHKGKPMTDVPHGYWKWAINEMKQFDEKSDYYDPDLAESVYNALEG